MGGNGREALVELLTPETYLPPSSSSSGSRVTFAGPSTTGVIRTIKTDEGFGSGGEVVQKKRPAYEMFLVLGLLGLAVFGLLIGLRYLLKKVNDLSRAVEAKTRPVLSVDQLEDVRRTLLSETETRVDEVRQLVDTNTANIAKLQQMIQQLAMLQLASIGATTEEGSNFVQTGEPHEENEPQEEENCEGETCQLKSAHRSEFRRPDYEHSPNDELGEDCGSIPAEFFSQATNGFFPPSQVFVVEVGGHQGAKEVGTTSDYTVTPVEDSPVKGHSSQPTTPKRGTAHTNETVSTPPTPAQSPLVKKSLVEEPAPSETERAEIHVADRPASEAPKSPGPKLVSSVTQDLKRRAKSKK
jgi:hypothetical protein